MRTSRTFFKNMCAPYLFISKLTITIITSTIQNWLLRYDVILTSRRSTNNCNIISSITISIQVLTLEILQNQTHTVCFVGKLINQTI